MEHVHLSQIHGRWQLNLSPQAMSALATVVRQAVDDYVGDTINEPDEQYALLTLQEAIEEEYGA